MGRVYAILGDIHSNIEALQTVLDDARAQGATHYVCVGDVVGYNAAPASISWHRMLSFSFAMASSITSSVSPFFMHSMAS